MRNKAKIALLTLAALTLTACGGNTFYDESRSVDPGGWNPQDSVCFDVEIDDTATLFNCLVEVRNSVAYRYSNAFLFVATTFPDGSMARDTMECTLADATGHWLGKRTGRYVDTRFRLRRGAMRFPMQGRYHFAITNGMRDEAIDGLHDVGLRIEYSNAR